MIMFDQSKRLSEPLRWGRREKAAVAAVLACLTLALVGLGLYALLDHSRGDERTGCIDMTFASTLGAANVHECGRKAREACASPSSIPVAPGVLAAECRRAGHSFGARG